MRQIFTPMDQQTLEHRRRENDLDINTLLSILLTRYPNGRTTVPRLGNIQLVWDFAEIKPCKSPPLYQQGSEHLRELTHLDLHQECSSISAACFVNFPGFHRLVHHQSVKVEQHASGTFL